MFATVNTVKLFFDVIGSGVDMSDTLLKTKPVIIALNGGYGYDHTYLRLGLDALSKDYQIVYVDMRGHGKSEAVKRSTIQFETMADDVAKLVEALGLESAIIFGHASGSFVAQKMAIRHPDKVKGLILVSSTMGMSVIPGKAEEGYPQFFLKDRVQGELLDVGHNFFFQPTALTDQDFQYYCHNIGPYYFATQNMGLCEKVISYVTYNIDLVNHYRRLMPFYNSQGQVSNIKQPTLLMAGMYDWATPPVGSYMLANKLPDCDYVEFDQSGHYPFIEEPEKFQDSVWSFIDKNSFAV
ncbi:alpha/beta hydrolase [Pantoea sp. Al-1710]|uniref:Alpha/beta hydrolase n=1 Tax=Candidatus Pantoea communis TaxID=2608354 RepID=A0ABX0RI02_9GAMM|nr:MULTISPECIES: alpha/beta hydrolase [Pantoea]NIG13029.1 alpha/beta hydrolase [Pantoea sp. Cy-640]NIG17270.1 alpha/beta hydrolase [Pantoea communis]